MAAQAASGILVKMMSSGGSPALTPVLGLRSRSIQFNAETVDTTNAESVGMWRELLDAAGVRSAQVSGDGVFVDDTGLEATRAAYFANAIKAMEFFVPGFGTFAGNFKCTQMQASGAYNGEVTFSVQYESSGAITFATV